MTFHVYYRVSTDKQDLDMQVNAVKNLLESKNIDYNKCEVYKDFGISGTISNRPEYQKMLSEVGEGDTIVSYEYSRLWRDMEEQSRAIKMLTALNVHILSVVDGEINKLIDSLFADLRGSINQYEARRTKERIITGIAAKKARIAAGTDTWKGRGKDKQERKKEGYFKRWAKTRNS